MMIRARMPRHKLGIGLLGVLASHERGGSGAANLTLKSDRACLSQAVWDQRDH